VIRLIFAPDND